MLRFLSGNDKEVVAEVVVIPLGNGNNATNFNALVTVYWDLKKLRMEFIVSDHTILEDISFRNIHWKIWGTSRKTVLILGNYSAAFVEQEVSYWLKKFFGALVT